MTRATTPGSAIIDRCPAFTLVMWAPARLAMNICSAAGRTRSAVPITSHDGMVFQAGGPDGSPSVLAASGRWVAAMTAAWLAGRPLAKQLGTRLCCLPVAEPTLA
jgi:hypothetical protein